MRRAASPTGCACAAQDRRQTRTLARRDGRTHNDLHRSEYGRHTYRYNGDVKRFVPYLGFLVIFVTGGLIVPHCGEADDLAIATLNACPTAVEALGGDISIQPGWSCGSTETHGSGFGHSQWTLPVWGKSGSATYQFAAERSGGEWTLVRAHLEVDGDTIDVKQCAGAADHGPGVGDAPAAAGSDSRNVPKVSVPAGLQALTAPYQKTGRVKFARGPTELKKRDKCSVTVRPNPAFPADSPHNCKVLLMCGEAVVYDGGDRGNTHCKVEDGKLRSARDSLTTSQDGDPRMDLSANWEVRIRDDEELDILVRLPKR